MHALKDLFHFPRNESKNSVSQNISKSFTPDIPQGLQDSCQGWVQDGQQEMMDDMRNLD